MRYWNAMALPTVNLVIPGCGGRFSRRGRAQDLVARLVEVGYDAGGQQR
ncbi:hypothetical protein IID10_00620 [candidate division KSB1 bacterium]|nr:hypothetical protein [candidate division KSB1 bacterium]